MDVVMVGRMYGQIEMELVFHVASVVHRCSSAQAQLGIPGRATVKIASPGIAFETRQTLCSACNCLLWALDK
jgi:hypothetical protein